MLRLGMSYTTCLADYSVCKTHDVFGGSDAVVQLRVQWSSGRGAECAPSLHWGDWEGPEASFQSVPASTSTYSAEEMCASPATGQGYRDIGWIHSALVEVAPGECIF